MPFEKIPEEYLCPITHEIMRDAVVAADGYSYERAAIEHWFTTSSLSPSTQEMLTDKSLRSNINLNQLITRFIDKQGQITKVTSPKTTASNHVLGTTQPTEQLGFFASPELNFRLPDRLCSSEKEYDELLKQATMMTGLSNCDTQKHVDAIKAFLFRKLWLQWVVAKFPYHATAPISCCISYHQYYLSDDDTLANTVSSMFLEDVKCCPAMQMTSYHNMKMANHLTLNRSKENIDRSSHVLCIITENDAENFYFKQELELLESKTKQKTIIPIIVDSSSSRSSLDAISLHYNSKMHEYEHCQFIVDIFCHIGLLNAETKRYFNSACDALKNKINIEFDESKIIESIADRRRRLDAIHERVMKKMFSNQ